MLWYQNICTALIPFAVVCANTSYRQNWIWACFAWFCISFFLFFFLFDSFLFVLGSILEVNREELLVKMIISDLPINNGFIVWNSLPGGRIILKDKKNITFKISPQSLIRRNRLILTLSQNGWLLSQNHINFFLISFFIFEYCICLKKLAFYVVYLDIFDCFQ